MRFIDEEITQEEVVWNNGKDSQQDILLDNLQAAITSLEDELEQIKAASSVNVRTLEGKINTSNSSLNTNLNNAVITLNNTIQQLQQSLSNKTITEELSSQLATITEIIAGNVRANSIVSEGSLTAANITAPKVHSDNAAITSLEAENITAETIKADELDIGQMNFDSLEAEKAEITDLKTDNAEITNLTVDTISVSDKDWKVPNTTPTNDELLKIHIPVYSGIVSIITKQNEFNVSIFNNSAATFNQLDEYIHRIEFVEDGTNIFLKNVGNSILYKEIHLGEATFDESSSEIVDRAFHNMNVGEMKGFISDKRITFQDEPELMFQPVEVLPEGGMKNVIYIVNGDKSYYCDGFNYYALTSDVVEDIDLDTLLGE